MPKRPCSSYFIFMNSKRVQLKIDKPDLKFGEVTKHLTKEWHALKDKTEWEKAAVLDKERFQKECEERGIVTKKDAKAAKKDG